ncbi:MAG: hypothetical protein ABIP95_05015 [Pelobium sp.]
MKEELVKRFFIRIFIGAVPMVFFAIALFTKGESGNSGMSLNIDKLLPVVLIFIWGAFLIIEGLNHFIKNRTSYGFCSLGAVAILGAVFLLLMYLEHIL